MGYTAAALTAAEAPVVLTIGAAAERPGLRRLSRWWLRRCRTWQAKPLSVPQLLQLQAVRQDPVRYLLTLATVLRAVLPWRWWYAFTGDPVRLISRLPPDLLPIVLQALVTVPGTGPAHAAPDEPLVEQLRRAQRAASYGPGAGATTLTVATAALTVRAAYGDSWYFNPQRWPTSDGYVPFGVALIECEGVQALAARRQIEVANGVAVAQTQDRRARQQLERAAYPRELA